ncbi:hypothetical protein [Encephalitozoon cuniculi GB-M1]|uniref:Condensin complex subunit 2 n=1 Tax=Encephalitozoon cuniculi (strain GB-M1) TaxID=284813 RepID=Q8SWA2_ENCCU|nr:uncharacterized protein ECU02_1290 [Encephalitozoon cuniculi GB-M1]CAD25158.1 hypothetical protein [Encephalitozoon cuniculi GB-M1]
MSNDDLGTWLKAAAENKITTKNTWKSTLIDHFTNIDEFRERQGINFQKASCTLDGCAKVYSTRVDDVSENAMRLLEGSGREEARKKQGKKVNKVTIEKNICNLNIKVSSSRRCVDPKFLYLSSLPENTLMIDSLGISSDGVLRMSSCRDEGTVIVDDFKMSMDFPKGLLISPSISEDKEIRDIVMEPIVDNDAEVSDEHAGFSGDNFELPEILPPSSNQNPVYKENSFSYFKGWAGPNHWKVQAKKGRSGTQKQKEASFLDFTETVDYEGMLEPGNTLFDPAFIVERRESRHTLPQDFRLEVEDLYRYLVRDGLFYKKDQASAEEEMSIDHSPASCVIEEPEDEFVADIPSQGSQKMPIPFRKTPKKVNIKKLKDSVLDSVKGGSTSLLSIFEGIPKVYNGEESKDISVHLCFISLLHLANEKNIQLKAVGNDIEVQMLQ